ncbi:MAG: DNA-binding response regulator [Pseudomonadaceae bacterium]|nr:MAG: DNA-binding response regulator [Pseudomonadaceae bacterium]
MHILLCEDDALIAAGIVTGLQQDNLLVEVASDARTADHLLSCANFDLLILDLGLPDMDGQRLLERLRQDGQRLPVLILSARDSIDERVKGLRAGADDYLLKPFDLRELSARVLGLLRRAGGHTGAVLQHGELQLDPATGDCRVGILGVELSRREQALLTALLQHPQQILSADQLKDRIYGLQEDVESNALNVHIHNLRRKLGNGLIETVRGLGYRLGKPLTGTPS